MVFVWSVRGQPDKTVRWLAYFRPTGMTTTAERLMHACNPPASADLDYRAVVVLVSSKDPQHPVKARRWHVVKLWLSRGTVPRLDTELRLSTLPVGGRFVQKEET